MTVREGSRSREWEKKRERNQWWERWDRVWGEEQGVKSWDKRFPKGSQSSKGKTSPHLLVLLSEHLNILSIWGQSHQRWAVSSACLSMAHDLGADSQKSCQNFTSLGSDKNEWDALEIPYSSCKVIHFPRAAEPPVAYFSSPALWQRFACSCLLRLLPILALSPSCWYPSNKSLSQNLFLLLATRTMIITCWEGCSWWKWCLGDVKLKLLLRNIWNNLDKEWIASQNSIWTKIDLKKKEISKHYLGKIKIKWWHVDCPILQFISHH